MSSVTLDEANIAIKGAFDKGRALWLQPLSVAVLDAGGHLIAFQRQAGTSLGRAQVAQGKAAGALALGVSSRKVGAMAQERPWFIGALASGAIYPIVPAAGGVILIDDAGRSIGAVGVTGDSSDNDELCALAGISAAGFRPQS